MVVLVESFNSPSVSLFRISYIKPTLCSYASTEFVSSQSTSKSRSPVKLLSYVIYVIAFVYTYFYVKLLFCAAKKVLTKLVKLDYF